MASQHAGALCGPGNWPAVVLTALPAADAVLTGLRLLLRPDGARGGPRRPNRQGNYPGRNREGPGDMPGRFAAGAVPGDGTRKSCLRRVAGGITGDWSGEPDSVT